MSGSPDPDQEWPLVDGLGNRLLAVDHQPGAVRERPDAPTPAALVVVVVGDAVLLVFGTWRRRWELPGGGLEPGETWHDAAVRELEEETGIAGVDLAPAAVATFELGDPARREHLAVYRAGLDDRPSLGVNDEISAFRWWCPTDPVEPDMSPLDAAIAGIVARPR